MHTIPSTAGRAGQAFTLRAGLAALALLAAGSASGADWPEYRLQASIDPAGHGLKVAADVVLPPGLAGQPVEFVLGANFTIAASSLPVTKLPAEAGDEAFAGINGTSAAMARRRGVARYRVALPTGATGFRVEYAGLVDMQPEVSPEEYARSFSETPGIVDPKGVYLAGSTLWYPQLAASAATELLTYTLTVNAPAGWHLVAPGDGDSGGADGEARWHSPAPVDEISLSGGPLTAYTAKAGRIEAQVYLRQADAALAGKYLDATSRYLRMYESLLGPYPYQKFALVENFWETGYGMPSYTLLGPQIIRFPFILNSSYPHEILHNWWGNSVYVDYATGNWCEGLTAYLADHLLKEVEGTGAEYRRDTLKRYRDFAATNADFPLREFRSRHSAATEAVGYGKTLMGFHMLRLQLGDEAFRRALARFYKEFRGQRASFADLRGVFESVGGRDLGRFFTEWVEQPGAADLAVTDVAVRQAGAGYAVSGVLRQRQRAILALEVPVVVATAAGPVATTVSSSAAATPFTIETRERALSVAVDPAFDVFRILDPRETAPSIGQILGAARVTAVVPGEPASDTEAWRQMLMSWQGPVSEITVVTDREIDAIPADRSVWLLGRGNRLAAGLFASDPAIGLAVGATGVTASGRELPFAGHSHVLTRRHPADAKLAVGWITADPPAAIAGLGRKLPHYGKYSWLAFAGTEPANVAKGEWRAADSPLVVSLQPAGAPVVLPELARRRALAEPPPVFSAEALQRHVSWLAAPERTGRGIGTPGLDAAAEYIREQFQTAGLAPGGDAGGWFQAFTAVTGPEQRDTALRNVVGVVRGTDPRFAGQAALVTAHYDHLGHGWPGARADSVGKLHPGADDNASGVAVMIEVAKQVAARPPPRTVVFVAFTGEESGLLGSRHYVKHPTPVPLAGIFGDLNLDTVGNLGDGPLSILATESAREWPFVFSGITAVTGVPTKSVVGASVSSDQQAFIDAGIPGVQLFARATLDYHRPSDTADKVDAAGMVKVAAVVGEAVGYLASTDKRLTVTGAGTGSGVPPPAARGDARKAALGAIPDFAFQGPGMRLDGVVPGSAAEKAGLKAGDILLRLGGDDVTGLGGFNEVLRKHQPGDRVKLEWTRDGAPASADAELTAR
ncbi:MAG: M20/M25/M40 family metallo-hydrolase [Gammaproteobacteria bacterium]|nr:M20/M25/M40 family metallo-hydrolase [Gammaproteobacteria bacterium]